MSCKNKDDVLGTRRFLESSNRLGHDVPLVKISCWPEIVAYSAGCPPDADDDGDGARGRDGAAVGWSTRRISRGAVCLHFSPTRLVYNTPGGPASRTGKPGIPADRTVDRGPVIELSSEESRLHSWRRKWGVPEGGDWAAEELGMGMGLEEDEGGSEARVVQTLSEAIEEERKARKARKGRPVSTIERLLQGLGGLGGSVKNWLGTPGGKDEESWERGWREEDEAAADPNAGLDTFRGRENNNTGGNGNGNRGTGNANGNGP